MTLSSIVSLVIFLVIVLGVLSISAKRKRAQGKKLSPIEIGAVAVVAWLASDAWPYIQGLF